MFRVVEIPVGILLATALVVLVLMLIAYVYRRAWKKAIGNDRRLVFRVKNHVHQCDRYVRLFAGSKLVAEEPFDSIEEVPIVKEDLLKEYKELRQINEPYSYKNE